jgi:hypothetical protein
MATGISTIPHLYNGVLILQRGDGYWNATAMCQANGKRWNNYLRNQETQEFLAELSREMQIPVARIRATGATTDEIGLVDTVQGGPSSLQGTWVHRRVAIDLARWCSPAFAVRVNGWVEELLTTGRVELPQPESQIERRPWGERLSDTFQRHRLYVVQEFLSGAFTTYTATATEILMIEDELIRHEVSLRYGDLPDGSIGKRWSNYRKAQGWAEPIGTAPLEMPHINSGGSPLIVPVFVYDATFRAKFDEWLNFTYIPECMPDYFNNKPEWRDQRLTLASAADNASLRLTGQRAAIPHRRRQELEDAGGFVPARRLLPPTN